MELVASVACGGDCLAAVIVRTAVSIESVADEVSVGVESVAGVACGGDCSNLPSPDLTTSEAWKAGASGLG